MVGFTIDKVDAFVAKLQQKGVKVRWEGWNIVFFKPHPRALSSKNGRRWGDEWGFETIISPNSHGLWLVNYRLARGANV